MHSSAWKEHTAPGGVRRFVFFSVLTFSEFQKAAPCSREIEAGVGRVSIFLLFSNDVFSYAGFTSCYQRDWLVVADV